MHKPLIHRVRRRRARGVALIEMVVVFLVLFYLVMGGVEFGWYLYAKHMVQAAARDGARIGILSNTTHAQTVASVNATMASAGFQNVGYTTTFERITYGGGSSLAYIPVSDVDSVAQGEGLRVTVTVPFGAFNIRPLGVIPANKQLVGQTVMVKE
jgi:Flp pilus assembly protein TadG